MSTPTISTRRRRALRTTLIVLVAIALLSASCVGFVLRTERGANFVLGRAVAQLDGKLSYAAARGTLPGPLTLEGVRYVDRGSGIDLAVERVTLDLGAAALLSRIVRVDALEARGVRLALATVATPAEPTADPWQPPIAFDVRQAAVLDATVTQDGEPVVDVRRLDLVGGWTDAGIDVAKLVLDAEQGRIDLAAKVSAADGHAGDARGAFRWVVGERTFAGSLAGESDGRTAEVQLALREPMAATAQVELEPRAAMPWQGRVTVPAFDWAALAPDSSVGLVALDLAGSGTKESAALTGTVAARGQVLRIDDAKLAYAAPRGETGAATLTLDPLAISLGGGAAHPATAAAARPNAPAADAQETETPPPSSDGAAEVATALQGARGVLEARGRVTLPAATPAEPEPPAQLDLDLAWRDVVLPPEVTGQTIASRGAVKVVGSSAQYDITGNLTAGPPDRAADLAVKLRGTPERIAFEQLDVVQPHGKLAATGTVTLGEPVGWDLDAKAQSFDPGAFAAEWPGALSFALETEGESTPDGPRADVRLANLSGTLRQRAVAGDARFHLEPGWRFDGEASLASGQSRVRVVGQAGAATDVAVTLAIASLADFTPEAAGAVEGSFTARGTWPQLAVVGRLDAQSVAYAGERAGTLALEANLASVQPPSGEASVSGTRVVAAGFELDTLTFAARGNEASHRIVLDAAGPELAVATELAGQARGCDAANGADASARVDRAACARRWNGTLSELELAFGELPPFALQREAAIVLDADTFSISESCLASTAAATPLEVSSTGAVKPATSVAGGAVGVAPRAVDSGNALVCLAAQRDAGGTDLQYRVSDVPVALILAAAAVDAPLRAEGAITGNGNLRRGVDGTWAGAATLGSARGAIAYPDTAEEPLLAYQRFSLEATLAPGRSTASVSAALNDGGTVEGDLVATPSGDTQALSGTIAVELGTLRFLELVTPEIASPKGTLAARYAIGGTLAAPALNGALTLADFSAEIPAAGLKLADGNLRLAATGGDLYELSGRIRSGDGTLVIGGTGGVAADAPFEATVAGENVLAADIPGARLVASPDLRLTREKGLLKVRGKVMLPSADIDLSKLPGGGAPQASRDVVVVDAEATDESAALPIDANLTFELGSDIDIVGYGLKGEVEGSLRVRERPGRATTGTGQIRVTGRYKAYGQDLTIERGRLLFATSPLDDPGLDIRAVRELRTVKPGLRITGTAKSPTLTVFSDPPMEQAQALSYLVTGRPLQSLSNSDAETVDVARRALQTAGGNLLAKSIGAKLGVDDIGVEESTALGGTAFTVGKYLSPRLYLSYGMGVFEPGQVVTLRYQLTERFDVEAQSGTIENRAGINYRIERD